MTDLKDDILDAALAHVAFDGWSDATLVAAAEDIGIEIAAARALFPRGAVDLAMAFHRRGDVAMVAGLTAGDLDQMKIREKITHAVRLRLELMADQKEAVRRGTTLFALPIHAGDGARALWETADSIWVAIGDSSEDYNWYTKRMTLSGVYSTTVLFWLGDTSEGHMATWGFLDRRIGDVMQFEKLKAQIRESKFLAPFLAGPNWLLDRVKPPSTTPPQDMPGHCGGRDQS
jgi:ubiquinone biosynthesis protein COQ9